MKVNQNISIFIGDSTKSERQGHGKVEKMESKKGRTIFGGDLNVKQDNILLRKQELQKKAMKVVGDANGNEQTIDNNIKDRKSKIRELQEDSSDSNKEINNIKDLITQSKETHGVTDDSQEQQDLELLLKNKESKKIGSQVSLTEDEKERISKMGELTSYQGEVLPLYESVDIYREQIKENQKEVSIETATITSIKLERLKTHAMVDATKEKDDMMAAASKEIYGMLMNEVKDHIDEEIKENEEKAEKKAEVEKEKEERIDAAQVKTDEEVTAGTQENTKDALQEIQKADTSRSDIQAEIKKVMLEEKLVEEDIKGMAVNTQC